MLKVWTAVSGSILLLIIYSPLAQTATGTIEGTVKDASGALIPGVEIVLSNLETGSARESISDDEGRFRFANVPHGRYRLAASLTGFKTSTSAFRLEVAGFQTINFLMKIGDVTETVEVVAAVQRVNTEEGTFSSRLSGAFQPE